MKKTMFIAIALGVGLAMPVKAMASRDDGAPKKIGAAITVKKAVDLARLEKDPKRFVGKTVRLEGTVKKVCQHAGCWVRMSNAAGAAFLAKSLDESVLLPNDCGGRRIVLQGVVTEMAAKERRGAPGARLRRRRPRLPHPHLSDRDAGDRALPGEALIAPFRLVTGTPGKYVKLEDTIKTKP